MHCDDKRTRTALKQFVIDASSELHDLDKQLKNEKNYDKKIEIQNQIKYLEKTISECKEQLSTMS